MNGLDQPEAEVEFSFARTRRSRHEEIHIRVDGLTEIDGHNGYHRGAEGNDAADENEALFLVRVHQIRNVFQQSGKLGIDGRGEERKNRHFLGVIFGKGQRDIFVTLTFCTWCHLRRSRRVRGSFDGNTLILREIE